MNKKAIVTSHHKHRPSFALDGWIIMHLMLHSIVSIFYVRSFHFNIILIVIVKVQINLLGRNKTNTFLDVSAIFAFKISCAYVKL